MLHLNDDSYLTIVGSIGAILNGTGRLFWGSILDKFPFKKLVTINNFIIAVASLAILWSYHNKVTYALTVFATNFAMGGFFAMYPVETVRIFGSDIGNRIYFMVTYGFGISTIIQTVAHISIVLYIGDEGYIYCFYGLLALEFLGLVLIQFMKYQYD